jgi:hypothetical protein
MNLKIIILALTWSPVSVMAQFNQNRALNSVKLTMELTPLLISEQPQFFVHRPIALDQKRIESPIKLSTKPPSVQSSPLETAINYYRHNPDQKKDYSWVVLIGHSLITKSEYAQQNRNP